MVYQIDAHCKRLLWIGEHRKSRPCCASSLVRPRAQPGAQLPRGMWKPYESDRQRLAPRCMLDRFHITPYVKGRSTVRARGQNAQAKGYDPLTTAAAQARRISMTNRRRGWPICCATTQSRCAVICWEEFQFFWRYRSAYWAGKFLDRWCTQTMHSQIEPMKKVARMLRRHRPLLLNWFRAKGQFSSGIVEDSPRRN
ncbi:MAG: transposase [Gammaproteobacteria bacterium]|nr:transposase [Gammaproteobacteria bacterium]